MSLNKLYHTIRKKIVRPKDIFPFLIFFVVFLLALFNYQPGTWLSGWDTLHPEFNFPLYFKRIFNFWQEHQGLGVPASQAHLAELPRMFIYYLLSWLLPASFLRYSYFFLTLLFGPLGIYYFLTKVIFKQSSLTVRTSSFIASLFYVLNLGTVQHYFVPFEMFATQFAALGWIFLFTCLFLEKARKKDLVLFSLVSFFSAPMAHTATLWYSFFLSFTLFLIVYNFRYKRSVKKIKRSFVLILACLIINAYWLLPNIYFIKNNSQSVRNSHIHSLFSEEAFLNSAQYGTIQNMALFKNFLFNWYDYNFDKGYFNKLLGVWGAHQEHFAVKPIGYAFFLIAILGIFFRSKKKGIKSGFLAIFLLSTFFWLNINPPFGKVFLWLCNVFPLFKEAFRFPFTKFSILLIFAVSIFLSFGLNALLKRVNRVIKKPKLIFVFSFSLLAFSLIYYILPAFKGNFISSNMRIKFPQEYFELFEWFDNKEKNGRIASLPINSIWGWQYYKWGYQGAGFLWFGLKQPLLDREFDRWHPTNEQFYNEFSQAIYSQNLELLESILEKYQINWLVLDKNITDIGEYKSLYFSETENLFDQSSKISLDKSFEDIKVYKVNLQTPIKDFVFLADNLPEINQYNWNNEDTAFQDYGHYQGITTNNASQRRANILLNQQSIIFYPFRSLFTGRKQEELEFQIEDRGNSFIFSSQNFPNLPNFPNNPNLPNLVKDESIFWTKDLKEQPIATPSVQFIPSLAWSTQGESGRVEVKIDKNKGYFSYDSQEDEDFFNLKPYSCNPFNTEEMKREMVEEKGQQFLRFSSIGSSNCLSVNLPHFIQKTGYLVKVQHQYVHGKQMLFKIINETSKNTIIETNLPKSNLESWFVIPPQEQYGQGYSLHFDNISIGRQRTVNDLGRVEIYPIPYRFLKQIKFQSSNFRLPPSDSVFSFPSSDFEVSHPNPSFYKISLDSSSILNTKYLILSQSYHPGWIAFYKDGGKWKRLEDHILVNNWQNGWRLNNETMKQWNNGTIYLFFLPQLLEYLGFGLLALFLLKLIFIKPKNYE